MKSIALLCAVLAASCTAALAADKAQIEARYLSYHAAGKAVVTMAVAKTVDPVVIRKHVDTMVADALWFAAEYAKAYPKGAKLLKTVVDHVDEMRRLPMNQLESEWHDLAYFQKPGRDAGLDLKAEENEHFTDPIHTLVHPLLVLKAAEAYAAKRKDEDLKSLKEEMEEGLEQAEKQKIALLKA